MGLFGGSSSSENEEILSSENVPPRESELDESSPAASASPSPNPATEKTAKDMAKELSTIPLNITVKFTSIAPMTLEEKKLARSRYATSCD